MNTPKIIFEDDYLLVLDKPAGWVVTDGETVKGPTIQNWLKDKVIGVNRNGIVHRLDKDTSGILLVAKDQKTLADLQKQFKERQIKKKYLALVHGLVRPEKGIIKANIARNPFNRKKFGVFLGGKEAITRYRVISNFKFLISNDYFTLVELEPKTGRTHQIRVHLKHLGYPIASDEFYVGGKTYRSDIKWCPRQFLHAVEISFFHPKTNLVINFKSPLPSDLKTVLPKLKKQ